LTPIDTPTSTLPLRKRLQHLAVTFVLFCVGPIVLVDGLAYLITMHLPAFTLAVNGQTTRMPSGHAVYPIMAVTTASVVFLAWLITMGQTFGQGDIIP